MDDDEFERLCDKHGLSEQCGCGAYGPICRCGGDEMIYPTLSELLDMVEKGWPDHDWMLKYEENGKFNEEREFIPGKRYIFYSHNTPAVMYYSSESRELAVLNAFDKMTNQEER